MYLSHAQLQHCAYFYCCIFVKNTPSFRKIVGNVFVHSRFSYQVFSPNCTWTFQTFLFPHGGGTFLVEMLPHQLLGSLQYSVWTIFFPIV